jgi:hypothetical protein
LWAGGSGFDDDHEPEADAGPSYFGFVKDTRGGVVADAKVTVAVKAGSGIVTRSNILGAYRVPGFSKEIDPNTVEVTCEKDGYKYVRTFRRSPPGAEVKTIEMECVLQRG